MDNVLIDFKRRGSHYECTTVSAIKEICERVSQHFFYSINSLALQLYFVS